MQGLAECAVSIGIGAAFPVFANVLFEPDADAAQATRPFLVSLGAVSVGTVLFHAAVWSELPTRQRVFRRRVSEGFLPEDEYHAKWTPVTAPLVAPPGAAGTPSRREETSNTPANGHADI